MNYVDPNVFATDRMLKNLQGNTLKGHGRDHTTHIFFRFDKNKIINAKKWIRAFAEDTLTSLKKQLEEREAFKTEKKPGDLFAAFFLTAEGYKTLGFINVANDFQDKAFLSGLKNRRKETNDPLYQKWEQGYDEEIHAMILLADDDLNRMGNFTKDLLDTLDAFSHINVVEYGNAIRNSKGAGIEHFGYVDGTSQPLFLKDEIEEYEKLHGVKLDPKLGNAPSENIPSDEVRADSSPSNNVTSDNPLFNPFAEKELILVPDPYAEQREDKPAFGSYFVFRKLEQNVRAFKEAEAKVGETLFPDEGDEFRRELAGAYLVGRFEDGTPVIMDDDDAIHNSSTFNNFNYDNDPSGGRCPHFAHIRMTNGRKEQFQHQRMARRGIPFGHRDVDTELDPIPQQTPTSGVGLLFMSYQRSIIDQFEAIQKAANTPIENNGNKVIDPIIGQSTLDSDTSDREYSLPKTYGKEDLSNPSLFKQFVTMKGGEYFFAPSLLFLKGLKPYSSLTASGGNTQN